MAYCKAPVIIFQDEHKNYYGKLLFFDLNYTSQFITGSSKSELITHFKKIMHQECEKKSDLKGNEEIRFDFGKASVKLKPFRRINNNFFPDKDEFTIESWYVFSLSDEGVVEILFPLEAISVCDLIPSKKLSKDKTSENISRNYVKKSATEMLSEYYKKKSYSEIITRHCPISADMEVVQGKIKSSRLEKNSDMRILSSNPFSKQITPLSAKDAKETFETAYERGDEINQLTGYIQTIPNSIIICGESGSGKSTILAAVIRNIERSNLLQKKNGWKDDSTSPRFWLSSAQKIKRGTKYLGEWEQQLQSVIEFIEQSQGILCFEKIIDLVDNIEHPDNSIASYLTETLQKSSLRIIGEATPNELLALRKLLPDFANKFMIFSVPKMDQDQAERVLQGYLNDFQKNHRKITVDPDVPKTVVRICSRFSGDSVLPGSAHSFLQRNLQICAANNKNTFTTTDVIKCFTEETGLPDWIFRTDRTLLEDEVFDALSRSIIGQPAACRSVMSTIIRFKAGLNNPKKPVASFLFCGPTGVGKTQLCKTLAQYLFNNKRISDRESLTDSASRHLFRLDMSEYQNFYSAIRLLEKPDGSPSSLIDLVRKTPFSVILFDEIEKADSSVFDILLSLLDEGRLTDRLGRTTSFRESIIIMTSNLGGKFSVPVGFPANKMRKGTDDIPDPEEAADQIITAVEKWFRPEFINRIDDIVVFNALDQNSSMEIVKLELKALEKLEGLASKNIHLQWSDAFLNGSLSRTMGKRWNK